MFMGTSAGLFRRGRARFIFPSNSSFQKERTQGRKVSPLAIPFTPDSTWPGHRQRRTGWVLRADHPTLACISRITSRVPDPGTQLIHFRSARTVIAASPGRGRPSPILTNREPSPRTIPILQRSPRVEGFEPPIRSGNLPTRCLEGAD